MASIRQCTASFARFHARCVRRQFAATQLTYRSSSSSAAGLPAGALSAPSVDEEGNLHFSVQRSPIATVEHQLSSAGQRLPAEHLQFHRAWLWQNAPAHRHSDSGQLTLDPVTLGSSRRVQSASLSDDGRTLTISWTSGESHSYDVAWLLTHRHDYSSLRAAAARAQPHALHASPRPLPDSNASRAAGTAPAVTTDCSVAAAQSSSLPRAGDRRVRREDVPQFAYADLLAREEAVHAWLVALNEHGLTLVTGAPTAEGSVLRVAERIAPPQVTLYGEAWEVAVQPRPINIAYAPVQLDLHMDLVYYESPPGLQLLHCRRFDEGVCGGESTFMDGLAAARDFAAAQPEHFWALASLPTTFQKVHYARQQPAHMLVQRPVFSLNTYHLQADLAAAAGSSDGQVGLRLDRPPAGVDLGAYVTGLFWAPQFEGPLSIAEQHVARYYAAYAAFASFLRRREGEGGGRHLAEFRMSPGDVSVFNNRRMLHGRRQFHAAAAAAGEGAGAGASAAGEPPQRVLQGCYVNCDDYRSRLLALCTRYGGGEGVKAIGNQYWL